MDVAYVHTERPSTFANVSCVNENTGNCGSNRSSLLTIPELRTMETQGFILRFNSMISDFIHDEIINDVSEIEKFISTLVWDR